MATTPFYDDLHVKGALARLAQSIQDGGESSYIGRICGLLDSNAATEDLSWAGEAPAPTDVTSNALPVQQVSGTKYQITNKEFMAAMAVPRSSLEDDRSGILQMRIDALAQAATAHKNKLIIDALVNGTTDTGHDGSAFFADAHADRSDLLAGVGTQDNLLAGTGVTADAFLTDLNSALSAMMGFKKESGQLLHGAGSSRFAVVAPPGIMRGVKDALGGDTISGDSNISVAGLSIDVVFDGRLSDANDWYLLAADKALVYSDRTPIEIDSDYNKFTREWTFITRFRGRVGYLHWGNAVKTTNT